jgi:hypothetical protein
MTRQVAFIAWVLFCVAPFLSSEGILESSANTPPAPPTHYYFAKEDGSNDWDAFYNCLRENGPKFNYIFVRSEHTNVYEERALNLVGNTLYFYDDGINYQFILRNDDPNYFGTVRRFNGTQVEAAISYFKEQMPDILGDILPWLLFF